MEYRVLGPLSASMDGVPRNLGGRRQRTVLAVLLAHANHVLGQEALIEEVWAGNPPETAKQTLHTYISTLRKTLGGQIEREGDGYSMKVDESSLDALRFEDHVDKARQVIVDSPVEALALLQQALGLWRGRAFGDLGGEPALVNEVIRLEEARVSALELRIEADLLLGNHAALVQELEALTREHPFRERLRSSLMLALYRSGRQADALRAYQQTRLFLGDQLGIDPTHELQDLEERILNQDPNLDWQSVGGQTSKGGRAARGYELREKVGQTSFGTVYRGFQNAVGREVTLLAIDEETSDDPRFVRRFESEMQAVSRLEHPHIAPLYDFWRDPECAYLVIPHMATGSLRTSLGSGSWNLSSTLRLVDQLSSALTYAHRIGFTHGSLGLDNVVLDEDSNAYICEFGLSDITDPESAEERGPARDVYHLAVLAFTALTGQPPEATTLISELRPDLAALNHVFQRARHRDPESRFQKPEEFRRALRQVAGADVVTASTGVAASVERRNPYKGLRAFHESDAADFHGRDALVEELVEAVAAGQLVTVVGPSGSGKSSLVRAGLVPALRSNAIEGSSTWLITEMFPGTHPFEELEAALIRIAVDRPPGFFEELTSDARGLARVIKKIVPGEEGELVLIIDQFEELFSLVTSDPVRTLFLESLIAAATDERSRIRTVLTLRADFFDQPLQYAAFGEVMRNSLIPVSPPTEDGLARAIAQPARDVGVDLEPGLISRIVDDVKDEPGGLPLMQYALTELFAARDHDTLTLAAYRNTGGVLGALGRRAEEIYRHLPDDGKEATRQLFLRLVTVDELADDTRRRVRQTELRNLGIGEGTLDDVLQQFGAFRLLSFDRDAATRTPTVEVAHEALIREWERLRTWVDERREDLMIHRRIMVNARDWEESDEDHSYLLRGNRLDQALIWQERTDIAISDDEMSFIESSIETEKREDAEHRALEEKAARRRKAAVGVLAAGLVVAALLGTLALDRAHAARVSEAVATAQELAAAAMVALTEDPELGVLLSLKALAATDGFDLDPVPEAISALRNTQRLMRVELRLPGGIQAIAVSPDGKTIVTDVSVEDRTGLAVWDADTGAIERHLQAPAGSTGVVNGLAFSTEADLLGASWDYSEDEAASYVEGSPVAAVDLYEPAAGRHYRSLMGEPGFYDPPSFSQSGLVTSSGEIFNRNTWAHVWDNTGELLDTYTSESNIWWSEFMPHSDILVRSYGPGGEVDGSQGRIEAIDIDSGRELWAFHTQDVDPQILAISPDGSMVAISDPSSRVQVRRIPDGEVLLDTPHQAPQALAWSPDGSRLAVSGNDADIVVLDIESESQIFTLTGHQASVWSTAFYPNGERLASASIDGEARVWNLTAAGSSGDRAVDLEGPAGEVWLGLETDRMLVSVQNGTYRIVNTVSGSVETSFPIPAAWPLGFDSNDSMTRAVGSNDDLDRAYLFDLATADVIRAFPECMATQALSADGRRAVLDSQIMCGSDTSTAPSHVLDLETNEVLIDLGPRKVIDGAFSPPVFDGTGYVVANLDFEVVEVYSLEGRRLVGSLDSGQIGLSPLEVSLDSEGRYLGIGTNGPKAVVVDMAAVMSGTSMEDAVVLDFEGHKANVPLVDVTSDGIAMSAGMDGFYRVWDIPSGEIMFELQADLTDPPSGGFTWDQTELAYEDAGGVIRFTPLDNDIVIERARAALTRELTDDECRRYLHTDGCDSGVD